MWTTFTWTGAARCKIDLAVAGWGYTVGVASDVQKVGAVVVTVPGHKGLRVQAHGPDWSSPIGVTGEATEYGQFAACITPLEADYYIVTVDGVQDEHGRATQLEARVQVDKRSIPLVEFVFFEPPAAPAAPSTRSCLSPRPSTNSARESARESAQPEAEAHVPAAGVGEASPAGGLSRLSGFAPDGAGRDVHSYRRSGQRTLDGHRWRGTFRL